MHWLYLIAAILCEVAGTTAMKASDGLRRPLPTALMFLGYLASIGLLSLSLRRLEVSVSYAIWSGLGTALITLVGWVWFHEAMSLGKVVSIALIIAGVVGLNLQSAGP